MIKVDEIKIEKCTKIPKKMVTKVVPLAYVKALKNKSDVVSVSSKGIQLNRDEWESLEDEGEESSVLLKLRVEDDMRELFQVMRVPSYREGKDNKDYSTSDFPSTPSLYFFVGSFKVGKSKICTDLCRVMNKKFVNYEKTTNKGPDPVINTVGEVLIHLGGDRGDVLVDTEGLNQVIKNKHSTFMRQFIIEHSTRFGVFLFYVIDKFTEEEYINVMNLLSLTKTYNPGCKFVLIHNIRSITLSSKLGEYMSLHDGNIQGLLGAHTIKRDNKDNVLCREIFIEHSGLKFFEMFCCNSSDKSYGNMVDKLNKMIENGSSMNTNSKSINDGIEAVINNILLYNKVNTEIKFDGLCSIDVSSNNYNPTSHIFTVRFRDEEYELGSNVIPVRKYIVSVPEGSRDKSKIKVSLSGTTIEISMVTLDLFSGTERSIRHMICAGDLIITVDSDQFTNKSLVMEESCCCFTFMVRINKSIKQSLSSTNID